MVRPIEMQMIVQRTDTAGQIKHNENQRPIQENTFAAHQAAKEVKHQNETVIAKDSLKYHEYKYDAKEKGNNEYQDSRKKKKKREQERKEQQMKNQNSQDDSQPRVNFDIKL